MTLSMAGHTMLCDLAAYLMFLLLPEDFNQRWVTVIKDAGEGYPKAYKGGMEDDTNDAGLIR